MEPCWEYFHCIKDDCVMFGRRDVRCWTVEGTLCNNLTVAHCPPPAGPGCKKDLCERARCIYLEAVREWERIHQ